MEIYNGKSKDKFIACGSGNKKFEVVNPLDDSAKVKGKKMNIQVVEERDGFTYLVWKHKRYQVDVLEKNQNKYIVMINGVWYSFTIETPISYKRRKYLDKTASSSKNENIIAPMPGKILDILVEENASIKKGDAVIILEAMKMQNEICANVSGKIKKIYIRQNDSVMKDELMVEIEKA